MSAKFHWLHWAGLDRSSSSEAESSMLGVQNKRMFLHAKAKEIKQKLVEVYRQECYEWKCEQTGEMRHFFMSTQHKKKKNTYSIYIDI